MKAAMKEQRRTGDQVSVAGDYQFKATTAGWAPQRFWHQARFEECLKALALAEGERVLDVGCGSGMFASAVARASESSTVVGVDANPSAIEFARENFRFANLRFENGLADELNLTPASFSRVSFLEVVEHMPMAQALETLRGFHRLLRPGGQLLISTPNRRSLYPLVEKVLDLTGLVPQLEGEQHVMIYDTASLRKLGEQAGFALVASQTVNAIAPWLAPLHWGGAWQVHRLEQRARVGFGGLIIQRFQK